MSHHVTTAINLGTLLVSVRIPVLAEEAVVAAEVVVVVVVVEEDHTPLVTTVIGLATWPVTAPKEEGSVISAVRLAIYQEIAQKMTENQQVY